MANHAVVHTKYGDVEGINENGLYLFKGIPYATPPVGDLRWLPPQPVKPWRGVRMVKEFGPIAPQNEMPAGIIMQTPQPKSEDCLFLNVWTPGLDNKKRPVMVWIHGGAFTIGSGSEPNFNGEILVKRGDIVFVSINYRLGMLGFLRLKDVTNGKIPATGNEGFLDQVAALKWVKDNIEGFGGNPENVTVFGESAGSMSIACLMVMPAAKGLFHKGILESGAGSVAVPKEEVNIYSEQFFKTAGIKSTDVMALRALTPAQLLEYEMKVRVANARKGEAAKITITTPVTDGEVIPDLPIKMAQKGVAKDIPIIIGTNLEEWKLFAAMEPGYEKIDEPEMMKRLALLVPSENQKVAGLYRQALQRYGGPVTPASVLTAIQTDLMFRIPSLELAAAQTQNKTPVYDYLFNWVSPVMNGVLGACHGLEIGFVFGTHDPLFCGTGPEADKLSENMQDAWLAFAKTGNPSCKALGQWPEYGDKRMTMIIGKTSHVESAPHEAERSVWDTVTHGDTLVI